MLNWFRKLISPKDPREMIREEAGKKKRKILLSYSWTLKFMNRKGFSADFFRDNLYYFGTDRDLVMADECRGPLQTFMRDNGIPVILFIVLRQILERAEKEGRVLWKKPGQQKSVRDLSEFLVRHGYKPIPEKHLDTLYEHEKVLRHLNGTDLAAFF